MKLLNYFLYVLFLVTTNAFEFTNEHGMNIKFRIHSNVLCHSDDGRFAGKEGITLIQCVQECALRPHCAAVTYRRFYNLCDMYLISSVNSIIRGNCVFVQATKIEITSDPCGNCLYGQYCDPASKICIFKECLLTNVSKTADTVGNRYGVNERLKIEECVHGYHVPNNIISKSTVCLETGQWNTSARCKKDCGDPPNIQDGQATLINMDNTNILCDAGYQTAKPTITCEESGSWESATCEALECGNPPTIQNGYVTMIDTFSANVICDVGYQAVNTTIACMFTGFWEPALCDRIACGFPPSITHGYIVPVKGNEIYYMDKARVTCESWYQTERSEIECTESGEWQSARCLDCYPADPHAYVGQMNVTKTGRICQRWDRQSPHPHTHTDLQYFPESILSEAENYCRDPEEGEYDPWCMTMDPEKEWEYCNVKKCPWV